MQIVRQMNELRDCIAGWRGEGQRIALVPTMGALHQGHVALIDAARTGGAKVVASIFVNPTQFAPNEDFERYPRREGSDTRMLADAGCDLLWMPAVETMYPAGFATSVHIAGLGALHDGVARPSHFDGVATVVAKLLNQVRPDLALFGEKDYQQLVIIRRMVADLDLAIEIVGVPTQREDDGLARSSRNIYLAPQERAKAVALPRALGVAARAIGRGDDPEAALADAHVALIAAGFAIDYVTLVDAETLTTDPLPERPRRLLAAARIGETRLIDNVAIENG